MHTKKSTCKNSIGIKFVRIKNAQTEEKKNAFCTQMKVLNDWSENKHEKNWLDFYLQRYKEVSRALDYFHWLLLRRHTKKIYINTKYTTTPEQSFASFSIGTDTPNIACIFSYQMDSHKFNTNSIIRLPTQYMPCILSSRKKKNESLADFNFCA